MTATLGQVRAVRSFQDRMARWPETASLTVGEFDAWIVGRTAELERDLSVPGLSRELVKELQEDAVAIAGAAVALCLFRQAHLP
jgi:hypothetical protein